jgi:hypothetical protein
LAKSTSYEAPHYAVFSNFLSLQLSLVHIFSSTNYSTACPKEETWRKGRDKEEKKSESMRGRKQKIRMVTPKSR